jgi:hypothetical protein
VFKFYYIYIVSSFNSTTRNVSGTPLLFLEISSPVSAVNINVFLINEIDLARKLYHQVTPFFPVKNVFMSLEHKLHVSEITFTEILNSSLVLTFMLTIFCEVYEFTKCMKNKYDCVQHNAFAVD